MTFRFTAFPILQPTVVRTIRETLTPRRVSFNSGITQKNMLHTGRNDKSKRRHGLQIRRSVDNRGKKKDKKEKECYTSTENTRVRALFIFVVGHAVTIASEIHVL